ncbi:TetR/AcrR family transcriptional regulator [Luteimicrobium sp. DT211]|uniref:TetR/AcrR family transcriptional regulator n=1 Tax=Luteimicrobium sp. DT211 TaxID=3393412 RepID=UPI003CF20EDE
MDPHAPPDAAADVPPAVRRRGAELEAALLDAAWDELTERGYGGFTYEGVAARAHTSRPVLYRRWPDRWRLAIEAIRHQGQKNPVVAPDTGNVRDDLIAFLLEASHKRKEFAALFSTIMAGYFGETGETVGELRERVLERTGPSAYGEIVDRALVRGELDPARLTPRVRSVVPDLMRNEILLTGRALTLDEVVSIVDEVFLPLAAARPSPPK